MKLNCFQFSLNFTESSIICWLKSVFCEIRKPLELMTWDSDLRKNWLEIFCFFPIFLELVDESLYEWNVKIIKLDPESPLAQDLKELAKKNGQDHILLSMTFKDSFPFSPPFVRIVSPVIWGGYIMNGGAICTELVYIIKYSTVTK